MKKSVAKKWVEALRSGKYKQGKGYLCRDGYYCCLGVLDKLYPKLNLSGGDTGMLLNFKLVGLRSSLGSFKDVENLTLGSLNDYQHIDSEGYTIMRNLTFDEIADVIQIEYIEGL